MSLRIESFEVSSSLRATTDEQFAEIPDPTKTAAAAIFSTSRLVILFIHPVHFLGLGVAEYSRYRGVSQVVNRSEGFVLVRSRRPDLSFFK